MIGILIAFVISWGLLFAIEKKNLLVLGFLPLAKRAKQFAIGFIITALLCIAAQYIESVLKSTTWALNESSSGGILWQSFWWDVKSVFTEELVFRGALLYILIQKIGSKGIWLSALAFGIYHWFTLGVLGNPLAMILVFTGTGIMGYAWALAFSRTKSLMLPFGLHLGWNFLNNSIFSKGPLGEGLLVLKNGNELGDWISLLNTSIGLILVPILVLIYVRHFVKEEGELNSIAE